MRFWLLVEMLITASISQVFIASLTILTTILPIMTYATKTTTVPPFNLSTPADTDIWRKPPSHDVFTAPSHPSPLRQFPLASFQRARISFSLPPANELRKYDQAGLLLRFTNSDGKREKWLKTGIEWYYGKPYVSTVGTDQWSDWSIVPLDPALPSNISRPSATVEARREGDELGTSMWVYQIISDENGKEVERRPLREIAWVFAEEEGWSVGVGGMVARPTAEGQNDKSVLAAEFSKGVEIEVLDYEKRM